MNAEKLAGVKTGFDILEQLRKLYKALSHYKPETTSMRINYKDRSSDLTLYLSIPETIKRKIRHVEIPAYIGYKIYEMYDESFNRVDYVVEYKDGKWILHANKLPASEKYLVIMKGSISKEALDRIVKVHAPEDPKKDEESDKYWIHSAIKDMRILEQIWRELAVERVSTNVRVGVERYFTTSIPRPIRMMLKTRESLLRAIESGQRERARLESQYRYWRRKTGATTGEIYELIRRLVSGEIFTNFILVDNPYEISSIEPTTPVLFIPEKVGVGVETDLSFQRPAAEGYLTFKKKDFSNHVSEEFKRFVTR
jgi:hypothetical protein